MARTLDAPFLLRASNHPRSVRAIALKSIPNAGGGKCADPVASSRISTSDRAGRTPTTAECGSHVSCRSRESTRRYHGFATASLVDNFLQSIQVGILISPSRARAQYASHDSNGRRSMAARCDWAHFALLQSSVREARNGMTASFFRPPRTTRLGSSMSTNSTAQHDDKNASMSNVMSNVPHCREQNAPALKCSLSVPSKPGQ